MDRDTGVSGMKMSGDKNLSKSTSNLGLCFVTCFAHELARAACIRREHYGMK